MIRSFRDRRTQEVFERQYVKTFSRELQRAALRKLVILDASLILEDLKIPPGNRLEKLSGDREGQYSIRINDQWRVCFIWMDRDAWEVEIVDYHH